MRTLNGEISRRCLFRSGCAPDRSRSVLDVAVTAACRSFVPDRRVLGDADRVIGIGIRYRRCRRRTRPRYPRHSQPAPAPRSSCLPSGLPIFVLVPVPVKLVGSPGGIAVLPVLLRRSRVIAGLPVMSGAVHDTSILVVGVVVLSVNRHRRRGGRLQYVVYLDYYCDVVLQRCAALLGRPRSPPSRRSGPWPRSPASVPDGHLYLRRCCWQSRTCSHPSRSALCASAVAAVDGLGYRAHRGVGGGVLVDGQGLRVRVGSRVARVGPAAVALIVLWPSPAPRSARSP